MTENNGQAGWICARCKQPQSEPKSHHTVKYCESCKPLAKQEQTRAYQKAHLADLRGARPDLAFQRKKASG